MLYPTPSANHSIERGRLQAAFAGGPSPQTFEPLKEDSLADIAELFCLGAQDIALLETCPVIAGFASLIRAWITELDLRKPPPFEQTPTSTSEEKLKQTPDSRKERGYWVMGMLLAGIGVGFGVAFMFLGAVQPQSSAVGRVWFLALILGFSTPTVLEKVERKVSKALDEKSKS